jgi:hypothetical protein
MLLCGKEGFLIALDNHTVDVALGRKAESFSEIHDRARGSGQDGGGWPGWMHPMLDAETFEDLAGVITIAPHIMNRLARGRDGDDEGAVTPTGPEGPALLNLKQCCANVRAFEIRIFASSIEKQFALDAFMQI